MITIITTNSHRKNDECHHETSVLASDTAQSHCPNRQNARGFEDADLKKVGDLDKDYDRLSSIHI